jgi:cytidylate kinase
VTASPDTRAARLVTAKGLKQAQAARAVNNSDAGRADYLKRFYGISEELPTHYDLVVNTDAVSVEQAAGLISLAASE